MKLLRHTLLAFSALCMLAPVACVRENFREPDPAGGTEDGEYVTLNFSVDLMEDAGQAVWTKSLGEAPAVKEVYVAVFDQGDILVDKIATAEPGTADDPRDEYQPGNADGNYLTRFHVTLKKTSESREVMFIAAGKENFIDVDAFDRIDEASFIKRFIVTDNVDVYWCRKHFDGISAASATQMQGLKMIRNFLKVSVSAADDLENFTLTGFKVFNKPRYGTLAPYNPNTDEYTFDSNNNASVNFNRFADYSAIENISDDDNNEAYKKLVENQKYVGYMPSIVEYVSMYEEVGSNNPETWFTNNMITPGGADYLYECTFTETANPFIIFKGRYSGTGASGKDTYYKADFVYQKDEASDKKYFHLLRNFFYELKITSVVSDGAETLEAAVNSPSMNNFEASAESQTYTVISKTGARMYISATDILVTDGLSAKVYLKNLTGADFSTIDNEAIEITDITNCINVKDVNMSEKTTPLIKYNPDDAAYTTALNDGTIDISNYDISRTGTNVTYNGSSGWVEYTINLSRNPKTFEENEMWQQSITFSDGAGGLTRTLVLSGRKPYGFDVDVQDYVPGNAGEQFTVDITLPSGISSKRFPLQFLIEPLDHTIYPDATSSAYPTLPVSSGTSNIPDHSERSYWFTRTINYDEYKAAHEDIQSNKTFTSYFKTLVPASATTIYVLSDAAASGYFAGVKSDYFVNERIPGSIVFGRDPFSISVGAKAFNTVRVNSGAPVSYSVQNVAVATVNATTGQVIGVSEGETVVTATIPQYKKYTAATATFTVIVAELLPDWSFEWDRLLTPVVNVGKTIATNTATATVSTGFSSSHPTVTYSSSDPSVASVDASGAVTGVASGKATITASSETEAFEEGGHTYAAVIESIHYEIEVVATGSRPAAGTEYINVPFTDGNMMWFTKSWKDLDSWNFRDDGLEYGIQAEAENASGDKVNSHSWLLSPVLDLRAAVNPVLKFNHTGNKWNRTGYTGDGTYGDLGVEYVPVLSEAAGNLYLARQRMREDAMVKISFDGGETWSDGSILSLEEYPTGYNWTSIDVSHSLKTLLEGKTETQLQNVRIAFEYKAESKTRPDDPYLYRPWTGCWQMKLFRIVEEAE